MIVAVFRLELRRSRALTGWLALVGALYAGMVAAIYPILRSNMAVFDDYMKLFPKEALSIFGMEGSLVDPGFFYNTYVGFMLWPIVAGIGGIVVATRAAADTERGWIELPLSGHLGRWRYLAASMGVQVVVIAALAASIIGAMLGVGAVAGDGFETGPFLLAGVASCLFGWLIAAVATLVAVATLSRGTAAGVVAGGLLLMYLLRAIATIQPDLNWIATLSAFHYLYPAAIIDSGTLPVGEALLFAVLSLAAWALAAWRFERRDLVV